MKIIKKTSLELSDEDLQLLNSPLGLKSLLGEKKTNLEKTLRLVKNELNFHEL